MYVTLSSFVFTAPLVLVVFLDIEKLFELELELELPLPLLLELELELPADC
jgi:hypothetical protein